MSLNLPEIFNAAEIFLIFASAAARCIALSKWRWWWWDDDYNGDGDDDDYNDDGDYNDDDDDLHTAAGPIQKLAGSR